MMYIIFDRTANVGRFDEEGDKFITFHTGNFLRLSAKDVSLVTEVQADGHEIDFLLACVPHLDKNKSVLVIRGPKAIEVVLRLCVIEQ